MRGNAEALPFSDFPQERLQGFSTGEGYPMTLFMWPEIFYFVEKILSTITQIPRSAMFNTAPTAWCY